MVRKVHKDQSSKQSTLEAAHGSCAQKLRIAQESAATNLKAGRKVQKELEDFVKKVRVMEKEMTGNALEAMTQQAMRTRVEVMQEYYRGEHVGWDLNETIRIYNEAYPMDAFPLHVAEDEVASVIPAVGEANPSIDDGVEPVAVEEKTDAPVDEDVGEDKGE